MISLNLVITSNVPSTQYVNGQYVNGRLIRGKLDPDASNPATTYSAPIALFVDNTDPLASVTAGTTVTLNV